MARFVDRNHLWLELLRERNGVVNVVEMTVRNQHRVDPVKLVALRILWIAFHPGIHDHDFSGIQTKLKSGVTEPRNLNHLSFLSRVSLSREVEFRRRNSQTPESRPVDGRLWGSHRTTI